MNEPICIAKEYTLVIDTDSSAYAFARELCAYCTGYNHESSISTKISDMFYEDLKIDDDEKFGLHAEEKNPFYNYVVDRLDEQGAYSPCSVYLNKKYGCNGSGDWALLTENNFEEYGYPAPLSVGIFFDQKPTDEHLAIIKTRSVQFFEKIWKNEIPVKIEGYRIIVQTKYAEEIILE
jgi:hypothetical protein